MNLENLGKFVLLLALFLFIAGSLIYLMGKGLGLTRFPGDVLFQRGGLKFYFPLGLSIFLSLILTILLNLFLRR